MLLVCQYWSRKQPFLSDPGIPGVQSMGPSLCHSQSLVDLTDVSLVDEDTNSILADNANRAIPGNLEMQVRKNIF